MIEQHIITPLIKAGSELHTACPFCGGTDRFIIFPEQNRAWCRQCNWKGDEIKLVMDLYHVGYREACQRLNITPKPMQTTTRPTRPTITASTPRTQSHDVSAWRASAQRLLERANDVLHEEREKKSSIAQWLNDRGLTELRAICGYIPTSYNATWGGLDVYIPSGFLLAWYDHPDAHPYKLNIRRLNATPNETKYFMVKGSENGLYNAHLIPLNPVAVLVEGEIDALSILQATNCKVTAVATGSTTGGRLQRYIAMLATRRLVLVAFDTDEAGENASRYWLSLLPNAKRLVPLAHDANDMLRNNISIKNWIQEAL